MLYGSSKKQLSILGHIFFLGLISLALMTILGCSSGNGSAGGNTNVQSLGNWHHSDWQFRQKMTLSSNVTTADLSHFPFLVKIADPGNPLFTAAQAEGEDILFTDSDGMTKLKHEIEKYDAGNHVLYAWVRVPLLSSTTNTEIYLYYGNDSVATQQNPSEVWDSHYKGVWHLKETPIIDNFAYDSTDNGNDGQFEGGMDEFAQMPGKIGGSLEFDGSDDMIRVPDDATLDTTQDEGTFELWINWGNAADGNHQIVMTSSNRFSAIRDGYEWASQGDGDHFFYPWGGDNDNYNLGPNPFANDVWHHLAVTLKRDTREVIIYVDGVPMAFTTENVPALWVQPASPDDWLWGGNPDRPTRYFLGLFDEIRVSDRVRSPEWINACVQSQGSPDAFQSLGVEEEY